MMKMMKTRNSTRSSKLFKIIFIVLLILSFTWMVSLKTDASYILTVEDTINDDFLNNNLGIEDNQIIENNIDWTKPGSYFVKYYNDETKDVETKDIIITSQEELTNGLNYNTTKKIYFKEGVSSKEVVYVSQNEYFIYGTFDSGYYPYQTQDNPVFAYVAYYQNGIMRWENTISETRYGVFNDAVLTDSGIALIGDYDSIDEQRNVVFMEFSKTGELLNKKELFGNHDDFGKKIFYEDEKYYFVTTSKSTNGDFNGINNDQNIIIASFTKETIDQPNITNIGNSGDDQFYDGIILNSKLYLYVEFKGVGYFSVDTNLSSYLALIMIDERLEPGFPISLENYNLLDTTKLAVINGKVSLFTKNYNSNSILLLTFDESLNYLKRYTILLNDSIQDFIIDRTSNLLLIKCKDELGNYYLNIVLIDESFASSTLYTKPIEIEVNQIISIQRDRNHQILFSELYNHEYIEINTYINYRVMEKINGLEDRIFYENQLCINGVSLDYQLLENTISTNPYGTYTNLYSYQYQDKIIILPMTTYFFDQINVNTKNTYDIGVILQFNGKGYLNGNLINSGYQIKETGNYLLEIVGNQNESKAVTFTVESLSENSIVKEDNHEVVFEYQEPILREYNNTPYKEVAALTSENTPNNNLIIICGAIFIGVLSGLAIPIKKKVKNND